jgi:hypothetical protein
VVVFLPNLRYLLIIGNPANTTQIGIPYRKGLVVDFEFIDESEIQAVSRGRKSNVPAELVKALTTVPKGKAVTIKAFACDPKSDDYKNDKASVSATIRSAGKQAGVKVSISWSPAGVPQVKVVTGKK